MRLLDRCLIVLFVVFAIVAPASAEPTVMTVAKAKVTFPAAELPIVKLVSYRVSGGFVVALHLEAPYHLPTPVSFFIEVNHSGHFLGGIVNDVTASLQGGESHWQIQQPAVSSSFNGEVMRIVVPGTYTVVATVPIMVTRNDGTQEVVYIAYSEEFEVRQYDAWVSYCIGTKGLRATFHVTSLWEHLPATSWVDFGHGEQLEDLTQLGNGFGVIVANTHVWNDQLTLRISGPPESFEGTFSVPDHLWKCTDEGPGRGVGKGSRTN